MNNVRWTRGGRRGGGGVGEGGPTAKTTHTCLSTLLRFRAPDLSMMETTRLDR